MNTQTTFNLEATPGDVETLRAWLSTHGWQTRRDLVAGLGWTERKVRIVAELMGANIVRGQAGFKLTTQLTREDLGSAVQAADAALSQGKRMIRYGLALKRKLHQAV